MADNDNDNSNVSKLLAPKTAKALKAMEENMAVVRETTTLMKEYQQIQATLQRTHYEALVKEGFTESQAMEIVIGVQHEPDAAV